MSARARAVTGLAILIGLVIGGWAFGRPLMARLDGSAARDPGTPSKPDSPANPDMVEADAHTRRQLGVTVENAQEREIVVPVRVPGTVLFDERRLTHLKPRTKGRVLSLAVQPGDLVRSNEVLATLDASGVLDARNGLAAAKAALGEALAGANAASTTLARTEALRKIGGVSVADVERRLLEEAKAKAAVKSAQAQVDLYTSQFERLAPTSGGDPGVSAIAAPFAGVVVSAAVTVGDNIDTNQDAFVIADPSRMLVLASLFGTNIDVVKAGDKATIEAPVAEHSRFEATVASVNAALDPLTNAAPARLDVANPQRLLRSNMFVTVAIQADLGRRGVTISAAAVQQTDEGPIAFVEVADGRFERHALTLGVQRADWVEVEKGIRSGARVATQGSFGLKALLMHDLLGSTD